MLSEQQANRAIELYADTVRRICMVHLKNQADSEDIFQTVFLKYLLRDQPFENEQPEKAWMIRVTINACKDLLRSFFRSRTVPLEQLVEVPQPFEPDERDLLEAVLALPAQYYYEQYTALEIAQILHKNVNTVYTLLRRARERLRKDLEGVMEVE